MVDPSATLNIDKVVAWLDSQGVISLIINKDEGKVEITERYGAKTMYYIKSEQDRFMLTWLRHCLSPAQKRTNQEILKG